MAPKAVNARKRFDLNARFRGHGPLLQGPWAAPTGAMGRSYRGHGAPRYFGLIVRNAVRMQAPDGMRCLRRHRGALALALTVSDLAIGQSAVPAHRTRRPHTTRDLSA
jgi:hypothetical protein